MITLFIKTEGNEEADKGKFMGNMKNVQGRIKSDFGLGLEIGVNLRAAMGRG